MRDLIERLVKATGPDRQLDRLIEESLPGARRHDDDRMVADGYVVEANGVQAYLPPPYTASLDAALKLVPEGWRWDVDWRPYARVWQDYQVGDDTMRGWGGTPAIALCVAALKVHALGKEPRSR